MIAHDADDNTLGAVYQSALPAWGVIPETKDTKCKLVGCLLRNGPVRGSEDQNADPSEHEVSYALRIPRGLSAPESGQPLMESLSLTTPLQAVPVSGNPPSAFSLASVSIDGAQEGQAILTAAKPSVDNTGGLVLRIYRSTNEALKLRVSVKDYASGKGALAAFPISALERPETKGDPIVIDGNGEFTLEAKWAQSTVLVARLSK